MAEIQIFNLTYSEDLIEHYQKLATLSGFVLLESNDRLRGRYDIVSALPYEELKIERNVSGFHHVFAALQKRLPQTVSAIDLPFQGGAIGYFSYDFAANLTGAHSVAQPSLENMPVVHVGLYDWAIISDHHLKKVYVFAANTRSETPLIVKEVLSVWHQVGDYNRPFGLTKPFTPLITKAEYQDAFHAIHQDLKKGRTYQVNFTQPFNAEYQGDSWVMYKKIRTKNPVPYSAYLHFSDADILSFSPERFLVMDKDKLLTSPIKGTEKRSSDPQRDELLRNSLLASSKNQAENVMIVDLLRNDLGKIAKPGSVHVRDLCAVESYQAVHHLVSNIEAIALEDQSMMDVFSACFPGGSITGAPKLEAMRIIAEQEAYARGVYCGSIGYFSRHGRFDSNIAIRTVVAREKILHMAAGGGIVIDSNWEDEYLECFTKIAAIINGLN
ncbi:MULTISPECIES: aminodeoxychorismate synthase component I [Legionella]|uniref:aminodeoxychorismate synthase n=1 Tax=Legionella maceachernii TaxID=466 RepID=A0A0W0VTT6_9GAMM|nr:aminodeoxychorismate synthase component I [Legionella maceachernii]KTD23498.1 para-aminobenzoate synthase, component I [Legionella maceachernii]SJZ70255.1 para-aminobenzoate synthetase component 1 [Legionella maceachernii]SUP02275.1 Para-aminobenzoate synthase component 1 [Legionella maceachernii]